MKAFVLTLRNVPERLSNARELLQTLAEVGIEADLFEAVDWRLARGDCRACGVSIHQRLGKGPVRDLSPGQVACAEGHLRIYESILSSRIQEPVLILEDDVQIVDLLAILTLFGSFPIAGDFVQIHESWHPFPALIERERFDSMREMEVGTWGTCGYFVSPRGASSLLELNSPIVAPADWFFKFPARFGLNGFITNNKLIHHLQYGFSHILGRNLG